MEKITFDNEKWVYYSPIAFIKAPTGRVLDDDIRWVDDYPFDYEAYIFTDGEDKLDISGGGIWDLDLGYNNLKYLNSGQLNLHYKITYQDRDSKDKTYIVEDTVKLDCYLENEMAQDAKDGKMYSLAIYATMMAQTSTGTRSFKVFQSWRDTIPYLDLSAFGNHFPGVSTTSLFSSCWAKYIDASALHFATMTTLSMMFRTCTYLKKVRFPLLGTSSKFTDVSYMFDGCSELEQVIFPEANWSIVTTGTGMFRNCTKLKYLDFSNCDFSGLATTTNMFQKCTSLEDVVFAKESLYYSISFANSSKLTEESVKSIFNALADNTNMSVLTLSKQVQQYVTDEMIREATDHKGWTITFA